MLVGLVDRADAVDSPINVCCRAFAVFVPRLAHRAGEEKILPCEGQNVGAHVVLRDDR